MYSKAGTVKHGDVVRMHGHRVVRCGANKSPAGVWTEGGQTTVMTLPSGAQVVTKTPIGVMIQGKFGEFGGTSE